MHCCFVLQFSDMYHTSKETSHSALHPSSIYPTGGDTTGLQSTNLSSLPSSIAKFRKQDVMEDENNNSAQMADAYLPDPGLHRMLDYTLASSVASTESRMSDNMSLLPNVGSSNTSGFPAALTSYPHSTEPSGRASPEDLSKLVDEMSSIRPVEETSSVRPSFFMDPSRDPSRIVSISEKSISTDFRRSWHGDGNMERLMSNGSVSSQVRLFHLKLKILRYLYSE